MIASAHQLAKRREALIARCQEEREQLARAVQPLKSASRIADRAVRVAVLLRAHPVLTAVGVGAIVFATRGRVFRWLFALLPFVGSALRARRAL